MSLTTQDLEALIRLIESNPELRKALRGALWRSEEFVEWLREHLPKLLQEDQRFGAEVVGVLAQALSPRSELVRVLEEIRALREDFARRFEAIDRRFEALQKEMDRRFELVDKRFEAIDRRFEALQKEMDRRFEALQREMDRRFEALQKEMDRRFELVDKRFEAIDRRFEALQREMDERFALHSRQIAQLQQDVILIQRDVRRLITGVGSLGRRVGLGFEEAVRQIVEEFAGLGPLKAARWVLRDEEGELFGVPRAEVEFDAFVHDGHQFLVEVKAFADVEDVYMFHKKVSFALKHLSGDVQAVLVAPFAHPRAVEIAKEIGVQIIGLAESEEQHTAQ